MVEVNLLSGQLKVRLDRCPDAAPHSFNRREVKTIKDGKIKVDRSELEALKGNRINEDIILLLIFYIM